MIVYIATNLSNGKVYVGNTIRDISHAKIRYHQRAKFARKYGTYGRFYSAIRKYGFENFSWHIAYRGTSDADIQMRERELITSLLVMDPIHGCNMTPGGDGNPMFGKTGTSHPAFGNRHTEETRKKISAAHKGKPKSDETRAKLSAIALKIVKLILLHELSINHASLIRAFKKQLNPFNKTKLQSDKLPTHRVIDRSNI